MRYLLFLPLCLLYCASPQTASQPPAVPAATTPTLIIGYTGGWGGGPAYKIENGQLYKSTKARALGMPADIVTTEFAPYEGAGGDALRKLAADYSPERVADGSAGFDCPEAASDRTCPYVIIVEKAKSQAYTRSIQNSATGAKFNAWMKRVVSVLDELR